MSPRRCCRTMKTARGNPVTIFDPRAPYYHVSTDYLLGLTMSRERSEDILLGDNSNSDTQESPPKLKLLANSISLVYDLLRSIKNSIFTETRGRVFNSRRL